MAQPELPPAELVIGAHGDDNTITRREIARSDAARDRIDLLLPEDVSVHRLFGDAQRLQHALRGTREEDHGVDLLNTFTVLGDQEALAEAAAELNEHDDVAYAYVIPPPEPALDPDAPEPAVSDAPAPAVTPDFTAMQVYLNAAPDGVDARWAWTRPGGRGTGIHVIDVEGAWRFTHEDLIVNQGGVIAGTESTDVAWRNHGTASIGEIGGDENTVGITGISPHSNVRAVSVFGGTGTAGAIVQAAQALSAGDVIVMPIHQPGPRHNFQQRQDQEGYIAVEWWPAVFDAIRFAVSRGIVVVEAAGNGRQDFDDPIYEIRPSGFPASWRNPLRSTGPDSGAVIVGAGAPPPGTNGRDHGPARSRLAFSNWGARVDVQGWGREVVTSGYGFLQGGTNEDLWYTDQYNGTSSAAPMLAGVVAAYQGMMAAGSGRRSPNQVRDRLRTTGSPQQDAPGRPVTQHIGNLPDLRALVGIRIPKTFKEPKLEKLEFKEIKDKQEKNEKRETKELKQEKLEKAESKEFKHEKLEVKELKIERKETKPEKIEIEVDRTWPPDLENPVWERLNPPVGPGDAGVPGPHASSDDRLAALEASVAQLTHFISQALRPDLRHGALGYEEPGDTDWQQP